MLPNIPVPRANEATDVLVESILITEITVLTANRSVTSKRTDWNVWVGAEKKQSFRDAADARAFAVQIATERGLPAWFREDASHPWEPLHVPQRRDV